MLLMRFQLIKSPSPVVPSQGLLLSERAVPEHTEFSLAENCLETLAEGLIVTEEECLN